MPSDTTEVISYGMPAYKYKKVIVYYAAFAKHCSLFPGPAVIEQFQEVLKDYKLSKGTIQFTVDKPLPAALPKKIEESEKKKPR